MGFWNRSVHSFLGLIDTNIAISPCECHATVSSSSSTTSPSGCLTAGAKRDPGGIGFIDDIADGVDGFMSCTESLGFESSDERTVDDEIELCWRKKPALKPNYWKNNGRKREVKMFPPPISSLNHNGQPRFFLQPVRKDGRLELTEVRIHQRQILHAVRQDGRLRLHLIRNQNCNIIDEQENQQVVDEQESQQAEEVKERIPEEEQEEERVGEWRFPAKTEGFRRCHELASRHHDHHHPSQLHVWNRHCVTTR